MAEGLKLVRSWDRIEEQLMLGRRIPDGAFLNQTREPGDYGLMNGYTGDKLAMFFIKPKPCKSRSVQHIVFPPHSYKIEADGSISISPSIGSMRGHDPATDDGYHGYLEFGVWRQV